MKLATVGMILLMFGGAGLDSEGNAWWIFAAMTLIGLALMYIGSEKEEKR